MLPVKHYSTSTNYPISSSPLDRHSLGLLYIVISTAFKDYHICFHMWQTSLLLHYSNLYIKDKPRP